MNLVAKRLRELFGYAKTVAKEQGIGAMLQRASGFFKRRLLGGLPGRYWPNEEALRSEHMADCTGFPTISILTPLYNTPKGFLKAFLDSVRAQTCACWQLVLADASDDGHAYVGEMAKTYVGTDDRIVYAKIKNNGIAANTNAAASLATGDYLALADHDDILAPHAVYCLAVTIRKTGAAFLYSDEALFTRSPKFAHTAHFKPDYAPEYLESCNYICHLAAFQKSLFERVGGQRSVCDGAQDHDLFLRMIDEMQKENPQSVPVHIPQVLYYWRVHAGSVSGGSQAKPYTEDAMLRAVSDHLAANGKAAYVEKGRFPGTCHVVGEEPEQGYGKVSVLIPNKDHARDLEKCLYNLYAGTFYEDIEVIVIENNSSEKETFAYYRDVPLRYEHCRVVTYKGSFNFSRIVNFGRRYATGKYLLLLNNDVVVRNGDWLDQMLGTLTVSNAGICGAMLWYPDDTVQHAGVITGLGGYAGHSHKYHPRGSGYMFRMATVQNFSAVTAGCMLVRAGVYDAVGGFDEGFPVAYNDVDFCLRVRDAGWKVVWTPYAELTHYESKSRGSDEEDPIKKARADAERARLYEKHGKQNILRDPYYNPSLSLDYEDFRESNDLRRLKTVEM